MFLWTRLFQSLYLNTCFKPLQFFAEEDRGYIRVLNFVPPLKHISRSIPRMLPFVSGFLSWISLSALIFLGIERTFLLFVREKSKPTGFGPGNLK